MLVFLTGVMVNTKVNLIAMPDVEIDLAGLF